MKRYLRSAITTAFAAALLGAAPVSAQTLGSAQSFAVVGGTAVTVAGAGSVITGDVGVSPGTSMTGFPAGATVVPPFATHVNDGAAIAAQASVSNLYTTLAGTGGAVAAAPELGGRTFTPGVHSFTTTANIAAGTTMRLSGAGIYIFKVGSAITANVGSSVVLEGGASACNVFWQVTSAATLNGVTFAGNVVAQSGVTLGVGAGLTGRALNTAAGPVTLAGGNTVGGCSTPPPVPPPACPTISLSPSTLPNGTVGVAYSQTILGNGGAAPYIFTLRSGALPAGTFLAANGVLAGTPTTAATSTFVIRGTDANGCFGERTYTVVIAAAPVIPPVCPTITLSPPTLPNGTVGIAYSQTILGSGGTAPYSFGITTGTLPAGLTLTPTGVLSGTPATAGSSTFTVRGTDANGCFAERIYTIAIAAAPVPPPGCPTITLPGVTPPNGTVGVAYSQMITASGGTAPYTFGLVAGALPAGLTLTPAGLFSGTPTVAGESAFTIRATDANGCFAERSYILQIAPPPAPPPTCPRITLLPETLGTTRVGVPINVQLLATGGTGPYVFGLVGGALPVGVLLSPSGLISGTPTTTGTVTFTIRGTDANGCFDERTFSVDVLPVAPVPPPVCPPITLSPATLPNATVGVAISVTLTASGGAGPYVFAVVGGALPPGVTLSPAGVISGTPTATGTSTFTIRVTDANGCPVERTFTVSVITAVPTLPQTFMILLSLGLGAAGYLRLRRRTRVM